jgi:hypothetical protein
MHKCRVGHGWPGASNGVWLAQQGLEVPAIDASAVGLEKAQALARERGATLRTVCADLAARDWPSQVLPVGYALPRAAKRKPGRAVRPRPGNSTEEGG